MKPLRPEYAALTAQDTQRIWKAMMLAPTIDICERLLKGDKIPLDQLDPEWVERFKLK